MALNLLHLRVQQLLRTGAAHVLLGNKVYPRVYSRRNALALRRGDRVSFTLAGGNSSMISGSESVDAARGGFAITQTRAANMAIAHLTALGHRRIAYFARGKHLICRNHDCHTFREHLLTPDYYWARKSFTTSQSRVGSSSGPNRHIVQRLRSFIMIFPQFAS